MTIASMVGSSSIVMNLLLMTSCGGIVRLTRKYSADSMLYLLWTFWCCVCGVRFRRAWIEGAPTLRRCVLAGHVTITDMRLVVLDLAANWKIVREFVRYTGPGHARCEVEKVSFPLVVMVKVGLK